MKRLLWIVALLSFNAAAQTQITTDQAPRRCCPTVIVYELGAADNFALPADAVHPSLALDTFLQATALPNLPPIAYDEGTSCDHHFGDSFKLDSCTFCCGICSATLEITMHGCGSGLDCNDSITVGQAPFNHGGVVLWNGYVNGTGCPNDPANPPIDQTPRPDVAAPTRRTGMGTPPIVKKIELDPRKLEELICDRKVRYLDVYIQDDQVVDSMRLVITKP
jgi:hypothetical protein